jgi:hypothetical protein
MQEEHGMQILGLMQGDGNLSRDTKLQERLKEIFGSADSYHRKESAPFINKSARFVYLSKDIEEHRELMVEADGIIFVTYIDLIHQLQTSIEQLSVLRVTRGLSLFGKWVGFAILSESENPLLKEIYTDRLLGSVNRLGMILLPNAMRFSRKGIRTGHVPLGRDMANVLSHQDEWKGLSIWHTIAA